MTERTGSHESNPAKPSVGRNPEGSSREADYFIPVAERTKIIQEATEAATKDYHQRNRGRFFRVFDRLRRWVSKRTDSGSAPPQTKSS